VDALYERVVRVWYHEVGEAACGTGHCGKCESGMDVDAVGVVCQDVRVIMGAVELGVKRVRDSLEHRGLQLV